MEAKTLHTWTSAGRDRYQLREEVRGASPFRLMFEGDHGEWFDAEEPEDIPVVYAELAWLAAEVERLKLEAARLAGWLAKIDGGDTPCRDEDVLRQWAYEAITLGRSPEDATLPRASRPVA